MVSIKRRTTVLFVAVAVVAVLIRLTPLLRSDISFAYFLTDSFEYLQLADGIRHGCGFARLVGGSCQAPEVVRTPGYPLFLTLMPSVRWALAGQALMGGIVCLLVAIWVAEYWNSKAALLAELMVTLSVPAVVMASEVMTETLFQFFVVLALIPPVLLVSRMHARRSQGKVHFTAALSGVLAGCAILVRPIGIIIPFVLPLPYFLSRVLTARQKLMAGGIAFATPLLITLAWSVRNYYTVGYPGLSTVGAIDMYYYRAGNIVGRVYGIPSATARNSLGAKLGVPYDRVFDPALQSPELTRRMKTLAFQILAAHPIETAMMTVQSAAYLALAPMRSELAVLLDTGEAHYVPLPHQGEGMWIFADDGINAGAPSVGRIRNKLRTLFRAPFCAVLVLYEIVAVLLLWTGIVRAIMRCAEPPFERRIWVWSLLVSGVLLLMLASGGEAGARFRAPVIPLLAIVSALGFFPQAYFEGEQPEVAEKPSDIPPLLQSRAIAT